MIKVINIACGKLLINHHIAEIKFPIFTQFVLYPSGQPVLVKGVKDHLFTKI